MTEKAIEKIRKELAAYKGDRYGNVMKAEIASALERLCRLEPEFAQAVLEGGSFDGCMKAVTKAIKGNSISDIDAYCAAAGYYFPGCKVSMTLSISMSGDINPEDAVSEAPAKEASRPGKTKGVMIDLTNFL